MEENMYNTAVYVIKWKETAQISYQTFVELGVT